MKIIIHPESFTLEVIRQNGDPKFKASNWCQDPLSTLLYRVKEILNKAGFDLIKKRMAKDGHMVDDLQPYLRSKGSKSGAPHIYVTDRMWNIRCAAKEFNSCGRTELSLVYDVFGKQPDCCERVKKLASKLA